MTFTEEKAIDSGYGDSDVFLIEYESEQCVRKVYHPERMVENLQKYLQPEKVKNLAGYAFLEPKIPLLQQVTAATLNEVRLEFPILEHILDQYQVDTEEIAVAVNQSEEFTYTFDDAAVLSIRFEVIKQGANVYRNASGSYVSDGQTAIPGKNLEQILGEEAEQKRQTIHASATDEYPSLFHDQQFITDALVKFNLDLMKKFLSTFDFENSPFAIFNRIHPANVIPVQESQGTWTFKVTDLSTVLCLDYALLIADLMQEA